ncbi:hypothetical protein C2W62_40320 [Candidatus Entotheonella serta]|nr:hypothetical protein C2W62_40320 [Candidatus Entotheonella serta]
MSHQHANQAHSRMTRAQSETSDVVVHDHDQEPSTSVHHEVTAHEDTAGDTRVPRATRFTRDFSQIQVSRTTQTMVQAKTTVSQPGDRYEREADRVAETVVKMPTPSASVTEQIDLTGPRISAARPNHVHRQSEATEDLLQAKASPGRPPDVTPQLQHDIRASQGSGQPLPHAVRDFFEPRFGQDFSQVRVHTDARSAASAQQLNAQAFTQGQNIFFAPGRYQPNTQGGQQLLAHELTHTVQQSGGESGVIARRVNTSETGANEAPQTELSASVDSLAQELLSLFQTDPQDRSNGVRHLLSGLEPLTREAVLIRVQAEICDLGILRSTARGLTSPLKSNRVAAAANPSSGRRPQTGSHSVWDRFCRFSTTCRSTERRRKSADDVYDL